MPSSVDSRTAWRRSSDRSGSPSAPDSPPSLVRLTQAITRSPSSSFVPGISTGLSPQLNTPASIWTRAPADGKSGRSPLGLGYGTMLTTSQGSGIGMQVMDTFLDAMGNTPLV